MAFRFQHRRDTEANWQGVILADGEIGIIQRNGTNTNLYKIGDGVTAFENLPLFGFNGTLSHTLEVSNGEQVANEAVSKDVLVAKFSTIDSKFTSLDEALELLSTKEELKSLSDIVTSNKNVYDEFVTETAGTLETIGTTLEEHKGSIEGLGESIEGLNETVSSHTESISSINSDLETLKTKHQTLTQAQYDTLESEGNLVDDVFYYIYEETE
jgi:predicted nuclease with TOPRIM domain